MRKEILIGEILARLAEKESLTEQEIGIAMKHLFSDEIDSEISAFLIGLKMKREK